MNLPMTPAVASPAGLVQFVRALAAGIITSWNVEHRTNGTHKLAWQNEPFYAGHYAGSGSMTWTLTIDDVRINRWVKFDSTLFWHLGLINTTVGGTPSSLLTVRLPHGFKSTQWTLSAVGRALDNSTAASVYAETLVDGLTVRFGRNDGTNWSAATNATELRAFLVLEVE